MAVIANALAVNYEVTILTHDKPESEDLSLFGLEGTNIHFRYIHLPPISCGNTCLAKHTAFYTRKESYHKYLSLHSGMDTAHSELSTKKLIKALNTEDYDFIIGVHAFLSLQLASIRHQLKAKRVIGWMHTSFDAFFNNPGFYLYDQKNTFNMKCLNWMEWWS